MSYARFCWPHKYVEGNSEDYIFLCSYKENRKKQKPYLESYGRMTNNTIVEICCRAIAEKYSEKEDKLFSKYLMKMLAERMGVKLRKKPLNKSAAELIKEARGKMAKGKVVSEGDAPKKARPD